MFKNHITGLGIISIILAIIGLILLFSSASFGISLGNSWLTGQVDGIADTSNYVMVMETYTNAFLITGGILFAAGLVTAILTYFTALFLGIKTPPEQEK
ncbi:hypothetical protein B481_0202 [Planococcus halocryophilus Or1]|uniref:Uncharacterized protein n=1 Tax=Planococcus halocryophilus TaxID=1215089 RepID=A0A1C7DSY7_9BACL|nr:hypothetical protein [Planococcus halocryophilus]ANU14448.1 hypothetical protein BBI08_11445 [Planococcus halocryophilus]EMF48086.1 hypothetical protein B481_0202 [Planococcus halocryophilus Or1]